MTRSPFSFLAGLLVCILAAGVCNAQTFSIDGPKTYNLTAAANFSIILRNLTTEDQQIQVQVEGNTDTQLEYYNVPVNLSAQGPGTELVVIYNPKGPATINARIIFFDGKATRDTVYVNGKDARFHDPLRPFRIYGANNKEMRGGTQDTTKYLYFKHAGAPWELPLMISNYSSASLGITAAFINPASGYSVSPASMTLAAYPSPSMTASATISYQKTGNQYDTAMLVIASTPAAVADTFVIIGIDTLYKPPKPYPVIKGDTVDFGWMQPGAEDHIIVHLNNPYPKQTIAIMEMVKDSGNGPGFGISVMHSYPFTIGAGKKDSFMLSFKAPQRQGVVSVARAGFVYLNPESRLDTFRFVFIGRTPACYPLEPEAPLTFESTIPEGGYTDALITLNNSSSTPLTVSSIDFANGYFPKFFSLRSPALPFTIPANTKQQLTVRFEPLHFLYADASAIMSISLEGAQAGCSDLVYEVFSSTIAADDTSHIDLYPAQTASLPMASEADTMTKRFTFRNNQMQVPVKVMSVSVKDGGHFTIISTDPAPLPVVLQPNEEFTVDVRFDAGVNGYYTDDLVIVTENALTSQTFRLKALRTNGLPASAKHAAVPGVFLYIVPNPATGRLVTCSAPEGTTRISIFDALGNVVAQKDHTAEWTWYSVTTAGVPVAAGVYFIRAEGVGDDGSPFLISKKLMIER